MKKFLPLVLLVAACTSPSGYGSPSPNTQQPATNLAQTVGNDQAAVPSTATGGQGYVNNIFASESDAVVRLKLLEIAAEKNWTPEQIEQAMRASSSAPQSVEIGNLNTNGGNASAIGSGTGGGVGQTGAGTVTKP